MGFDKTVAENALISCGRHCCLCHKFCGTKMELHHINQKKHGGDDSFDNCLPLCFDCHSDVMTYNPDHPKGKKYTFSELKRHRANWYDKVKFSEGTKVTKSNYLNLDMKTFERLNELLDSKSLMWFIKNNGFISGPFPDKIYTDVYKFILECDLPEFEFIDADLEGIKSELYDDFKLLDNLISKYTFTAGPNRQSIPREWEMKFPEKLENAILDFQRITPIISKNYESLIKLARRKLYSD
ncbi:HNH endonuclease [Kordia jejudonensis]|uniref:HNH endonuclease n=1 Tax=Kordia jejudonensis TaxID=1348245 RepID=UPI00062922DB|nr:HNH endonuclease signature motif containing protein [Kordia jejudonensis]